ncbi:hypothetical protein SAMN05216374_4238 [Tardiphaga sp. OK246]|uniref:hypothetical protein n=1 Tax=Tardiphaga sp. OK246 TaxID=1855307 RepID=UPI000B755A55|nr:hypothetical protein [Tardiphaga sp. OK246]SNT49770.1 hypothetical protein SAMN05216374_4238 [Tardiphaga sp. OK246]
MVRPHLVAELIALPADKLAALLQSVLVAMPADERVALLQSVKEKTRKPPGRPVGFVPLQKAINFAHHLFFRRMISNESKDVSVKIIARYLGFDTSDVGVMGRLNSIAAFQDKRVSEHARAIRDNMTEIEKAEIVSAVSALRE